jgi:hypothetical protein
MVSILAGSQPGQEFRGVYSMLATSRNRVIASVTNPSNATPCRRWKGKYSWSRRATEWKATGTESSDSA